MSNDDVSTAWQNAIEEIKEKADLIQIIEETDPEFSLKRSGKYFVGSQHDSLTVDPRLGIYVWYSKEGSKGAKGDVFNWLEHHGGKPDFAANVRELADRYGVQLPSAIRTGGSGGQDPQYKVKTDVLTVATQWLQKKLQENPRVMAYARGRGWRDETIQEAQLGYTGHHGGKSRDQLYKDLKGELELHELDPFSAAAVAVLGLRPTKGVEGLREWATKYGVEFEALPESAREKGILYGLIDFPRLVYPHVVRGRVVYLSARNLKKDGDQLVGDGEHKSWNLPSCLVGERQRHFNQIYFGKAEDVVICEGPADGITWGQWGFAAIDLCGTAASEALQDQLKGHKRIFIGTDMDEAGRRAARQLGEILGATARVVEYPIPEGAGVDANDWLRALKRSEMAASLEEEQKLAMDLLGKATPFVIWLASGLEGLSPLRAEGVLGKVVKMCSQMDPEHYDYYRDEIGSATGKGVRWLDRQVKRIRDEVKEKKKDERLPVVPFCGRMIPEDINGETQWWLVDVIYDPAKNQSLLAWRSPDGEMGVGDELVINEVQYEPPSHMEMLYGRRSPEEVIVLPSGLGKEVSTKVMVSTIHEFLNYYYYWSDPKWSKLAAYYVLLTWVYDAMPFVPYFRALGDYDSGKSQLIWRVGYLCYRLIKTSGAATASPIFRILEDWGGTLMLDEMDTKNKDKYSDFMTILLTGYQKGIPVLRSGDGGGGKFVVQAFNVYGAKLVATRERFLDRALESRCLTHETVAIDAAELMSKGVPLILPPQFYEDAREIRNMALTWRYNNWKELIFTDADFPVGASTRLQQVTAGLLKLADDDEIKQDVEDLIRKFMQYEVSERAMTAEAKILEALIQMALDPELQEQYRKRVKDVGLAQQDAVLIQEGVVAGVYCGAIAWRANRLMEESIEVDSGREGVSGGEGGKGGDEKSITGKGVAETCKKKFGLIVASDLRHRTNGTPVLYNEERVNGLRMRYGI